MSRPLDRFFASDASKKKRKVKRLPLAPTVGRLRVLLIRDASLLDRESMRQVAVLAKEAGAQLWVERVEDDSETAVLIEDGSVVER